MALPEPLLETTALAAPLLAELAATAATAPAPIGRRLEAIAAGELAAAVGRHPSGSAGARWPGPTVPTCWCWSPRVPGDGRRPRGPCGRGGRRSTVDPGALPRPHPAAGHPRLDARPRTPGWPREPTPRAAIRRTADRAAVATAAELLGLTERMITMAADYAKERHQFGKPIGSFQAVKHLLAGAQVKLEFARPVVYAAAWALDEGEPDRLAGGVDGQGLRLGRRHRGGPGVPPGPRGHRLHLGVRPPPVPQAGLGPGRGVGLGGRPPRRGSWTRSPPA